MTRSFTRPALHLVGCVLLLASSWLPEAANAEFMDIEDYEWEEYGFEIGPKQLRYTTPDENWRFRVGGRLHLDFYGFDDDVTDLGDDGFELRRARLYGTIQAFEDWKFKIDGELSDSQNRRGWRNLWLQWRPLEKLRLRIGNQISPITIEEFTSSNDLTFMERSLINGMAPGFLTGLSALYSGEQDWSLIGGVYFEPLGSQDNDKRKADGVSFITRATWAPWFDREDPTCFVHLGASFEYRNVDDGIRLRTRPESGGATRLVDTGALTDADDSLTFGVETAAVWGPVSAQAEFLGVNVMRSTDVFFWGAYGQLSWMPTGESRRYSPKRGAFLSMRPKSRWGALELAARYSYIDLQDGDVLGGKEQNVTLGVNWHLTRYIRLMFNYIFIDAELPVTGISDDPQIAEFRIQVAF
jgi:phosphate-selective porin OprO/OprP